MFLLHYTLSNSNEEVGDCILEPRALVTEYYQRVDRMAQTGYASGEIDDVYALSSGQAVEVIKSDVAYFGDGTIKQLGDTRLITIDVTTVSTRESSVLRANVTLDVSAVAYDREGEGEVVTNRDSDLVRTTLTILEDAGCLRVSGIEFS